MVATVAALHSIGLATEAHADASSQGFITTIIPAIQQPGPRMTTDAVTLDPTTYADLPGWADDDHLSAWKAFIASCKPVLSAARSGAKSGTQTPSQNLLSACERALGIARTAAPQTKAGAKLFFETHFTPNAVTQSVNPGLLTGYYEPLVQGSRTRDGEFQTPVYKRPPDLVNMVAESERGAKSHQLTHMRQTDAGLVPHLTRAEIEQGALSDQGLELLFFRDPVDVFFMQIQGSARIELPNGETVRITYDGKNGYPYTSIGRHLIDAGKLTQDNMSLKALSAWLKADRPRAEPIMWKNQSYVFFRELKGAESESAMGVLKIALQPGRSLAVDTAFHAIGTPIYVAAPEIKHTTKSGGFHRLMIAQDVGSAIKGPERGDIYFGSGDAAGRKAGVTKHPGRFYILVANDPTDSKTTASERP